MFPLGLVLACLVAGPATPAASPDPKALAVPPAEQARARELVAKLGSQCFDDREAAQAELARMGRLAYPALLDGLNASTSSEVRFRCQELLPRAFAADLQARLDAFLADTDCKYAHDLPGWNEFKKVAGDTRTARSVFHDLLADRENREMILAVGGPGWALGEAVAARKQELYRWRFPRAQPGGTPPPRREPAVADVVALLFAESQAPTRFVPVGRGVVSMTTLLGSAGVTAAFGEEDEKGPVYRAVAGHWIETRDEPASMYQAMNVGTNLGLTEPVVTVAAKLIGQNVGPGVYRGAAVMTLARLEAKQHLGALEGLFSDDAQVVKQIRPGVNGQQHEEVMQVRDVALAAALLLTGQDPEDYGFAPRIRAEGAAARFSYSNWFIPEEKRAEAMAKWKAWRADHPDADRTKAKR